MKSNALEVAITLFAVGVAILVVVGAGWIGEHRTSTEPAQHTHVTAPCFEHEMRVDLAWYGDGGEPQAYQLCVHLDDIIHGGN